MTTLLTAIVPCIAVALAAPIEPPASTRTAKGAVVQPKSEPPAQPTAEDVLRSLRHRQPVNDVIPPGSRAARDAVASNTTPTKRLLMPEGLSVVGRTGRLSREGQWWIFAFDDDASHPPMKLLPNANLELMVGTLRGASAPIRFSVTGELTLFEGENFLLPRTTALAAGAAAITASPEPSAAKGTGDQASSSVRLRPDAPAEDVLAAMQAQQPTAAILPISASASDEEDRTQSADYSGTFMSDGSPLIHRVGRLVRQESWWTFVSDSDRLEQPDPPLRLLPNQSVELMVKETPREGGGVFTVSGEVTSFDGENYLLTRVATRRVDTGNLRK